MKSWALCIGAGILAGVANAGSCGPCGSQKCLAAVGADPAAGEAFCSSWLSLAPATTTITETAVETATSTLVDIETALTTVTLTTATTTLIGGLVTTVYQKRAPTIDAPDPDATPTPAPSSSPADPVDAIVSQCKSKDSRISKACSCFLSTAATSTVTVTVSETAVSTAVVEASSTTVETVTTNVVATVSVAPPAVTIPANPILNGGFESATANINPWTDTTATTGGRVEVINGVNACTSTGYCGGGRIVVRVTPPTAGTTYRYTALSEVFNAKPSTTYAVSFIYRCLNFDTSSAVQVWYAGALVGTAPCPTINSSAFNRATGIRFTTGPTGSGEIQIRFLNPTNTKYLYYYADDFQAAAV
ncbi:hypothetical protein B0T22DRAFT_520716 [Podospora appendiculata]|uniref:CBM-cenC domain-containing protein n=1 Tax=Podospora appendiculata TaxID=314037 RepID=A0AAE0X414_9PEZI|nr:hypothetical protein B0T22DRAFT_520716 [Podospora appendiculata]